MLNTGVFFIQDSMKWQLAAAVGGQGEEVFEKFSLTEQIGSLVRRFGEERGHIIAIAICLFVVWVINFLIANFCGRVARFILGLADIALAVGCFVNRNALTGVQGIFYRVHPISLLVMLIILALYGIRLVVKAMKGENV